MFLELGLLLYLRAFDRSILQWARYLLIVFFFYNKKPALYFAYAEFCVFFSCGDTNLEYFWVFEFQWMMIAALPFIILYNGERGRYSLKYLFYAFYPLHIWILYFIRWQVD